MFRSLFTTLSKGQSVDNKPTVFSSQELASLKLESNPYYKKFQTLALRMQKKIAEEKIDLSNALSMSPNLKKLAEASNKARHQFKNSLRTTANWTLACYNLNIADETFTPLCLSQYIINKLGHPDIRSYLIVFNKKAELWQIMEDPDKFQMGEAPCTTDFYDLNKTISAKELMPLLERFGYRIEQLLLPSTSEKSKDINYTYQTLNNPDLEIKSEAKEKQQASPKKNLYSSFNTSADNSKQLIHKMRLFVAQGNDAEDKGIIPDELLDQISFYNEENNTGNKEVDLNVALDHISLDTRSDKPGFLDSAGSISPIKKNSRFKSFSNEENNTGNKKVDLNVTIDQISIDTRSDKPGFLNSTGSISPIKENSRFKMS